MLPSRFLPSLIFLVAGLATLSSQSLLNNRIVNGHRVDIEDNPWAVYLQSTECTTEDDWETCVKYNCGATAITSCHLLTAAHCVNPLAIASGTASAVVGTSNIQNPPIKNIYYIEDWNKYSGYIYVTKKFVDGDVAVLTLNRPLDFGAGIEKVELPPRGQEVPDGTEGEIAGWGVIDGENKTRTNRLMKTTLTINNCSNYVAEESTLKGVFTERVLCARKSDTTPCFGDSGSGLIRRQGSKYIIEGVYSFALGNCNLAMPGGFAKVSNPDIYDFINSSIQNPTSCDWQ